MTNEGVFFKKHGRLDEVKGVHMKVKHTKSSYEIAST